MWGVQMLWPTYCLKIEKITLVTKIKADISLSHKFCQTTINQAFHILSRINKIEQKHIYTVEEIEWAWQMDLIYVMMEIFYQTRRSYLKLVSYLVLKPKLAMRYPIMVGILIFEKKVMPFLKNVNKQLYQYNKDEFETMMAAVPKLSYAVSHYVSHLLRTNM